MTHFYINERSDRDLTILDLEGGLGIGWSNMFFGITLQQLSENGRNQIILNFSDVSDIDAAGLGTLIEGHQKVSEVGGQLKICSLNSKALELMTITKLLTVFDVYENEKTAIDSFHIRRNHHGRNHI